MAEEQILIVEETELDNLLMLLESQTADDFEIIQTEFVLNDD